MAQFWTELKPNREYLFWARHVTVYPLIPAPAQGEKRKFFLPVEKPKGKLLGLSIYSNVDLSEGLDEDGLFKINAKLMRSKNNPDVYYVHLYIGKKPVPVENINDTVTKELYLVYTNEEFDGENYYRRNKLIMAHPDDLVIYYGIDVEESGSKKISRVPMKNKYVWLAFITEPDRPHQVLDEVVLPVKKATDLARDPLLALTLGKI